MPKGGHARSGPPRDPNSRTSERRGFTPTSLPASGFDGEVPDISEYLPDATPRHDQVWRQLWSLPQACMWDRQPWMIPTVADLVRCRVRSEAPDAAASWETPITQKSTELGLTEAGMRFNGWAVAHDQTAEKRAEKEQEGPVADSPKRERRLRSVGAQ